MTIYCQCSKLLIRKRDNQMNFNEWVKFLREEKGWSQDKLAKEAKIARSTVSAIEVGTVAAENILTSNILNLARALGRNPVEFLFKAGLLSPNELPKEEKGGLRLPEPATEEDYKLIEPVVMAILHRRDMMIDKTRNSSGQPTVKGTVLEPGQAFVPFPEDLQEVSDFATQARMSDAIIRKATEPGQVNEKVQESDNQTPPENIRGSEPEKIKVKNSEKNGHK
jgi:transcriptional regulator with XRE-family HTH domain